MRIYNFDENLNFLDLKRKPLVLGSKPSHLGGERVGWRGNKEKCLGDWLLE